MADLCKQCSIEWFGEDCEDFVYERSLKLPVGMGWGVFCESCGVICVNDLGECISKDCPIHGGLLPNISKDVIRAIQKGDFEDNETIDTACAKRLLNICKDYGGDGVEATNFIKLACRKIGVYI